MRTMLIPPHHQARPPKKCYAFEDTTKAQGTIHSSPSKYAHFRPIIELSTPPSYNSSINTFDRLSGQRPPALKNWYEIINNAPIN